MSFKIERDVGQLVHGCVQIMAICEIMCHLIVLGKTKHLLCLLLIYFRIYIWLINPIDILNNQIYFCSMSVTNLISHNMHLVNHILMSCKKNITVLNVICRDFPTVFKFVKINNNNNNKYSNKQSVFQKKKFLFCFKYTYYLNI